MIKVGLTGGIGSGKSIIAEIFKHIGIPVFNADTEAKIITNTDSDVIQRIKSEFGNDIYCNDEIDRKKLATIIFNDHNALSTVNSIIHPKVREYFINWMNNLGDVPYVVEEAAILFESNANKEMDFIINVNADELLRIERVVKRDQTTREAVKIRMKNQMSDFERSKLADFTINNNTDDMVLPQVLQIHQQILKRIK